MKNRGSKNRWLASVTALGILALAAPLGAQETGQITGTVTRETGEPLSGVSVAVVNTSVAALTGTDGRYTVRVQPGQHTVRATLIGYGPQTLAVTVTAGETAVADFLLSAEAVALDELVVVGYGTQRRMEVTGAVASVEAEQIGERPVASAVQALQGRLPGLRVTQGSGQPGQEGLDMRIRGVGSFASDNAPLVIVDGVVGSISNLNPASIESITVLKDAASAAIYGARAANGVVLVTTKRGAGADGLEMRYGGKVMNQSRINFPEMVWNSVEWMTMYNQAVEASGLGYPSYPQDVIDLYRTPSVQYPSVNWEREVLKDVTVHSHDLSFSGRTGNTNYYANLGLWNQDGVFRGFSFEKYTAVLNLDSPINDRLRFEISLKGVSEKQKEPYNGAGDVFISLLRSRPTYGPLLPDGSGRYTSRAWPEYELAAGEKNLFGLAEMGGIWRDHIGIIGTAAVDVTLLPGLIWTTRAGLQFDQNQYKRQIPMIPTYVYNTGEFDMYADNRGQIELNQDVSSYNYYTAYSTLSYDTRLGDEHRVQLMGGASVEKSTNDSLSAYRRGFASHSLDVISAGPAEGQTTGGWLSEYALASIFGRANYAFRDRYLFEASLRRDGSSRFPPAHKYAVFPSFSAGWRIAEEPFLRERAPWLSELKLRGSYGKLGKDDVSGNYPYQSTLDLGWDYPMGSGVQAGVVRTQLNNPRIRWEETKITDVGVDLVAWDGLVSATLDYYVKTTSGILRPAQIPGYAGLSAPVVNQGVVENRGVEVVLGHRNRLGDLSYGANVNFATFRNELVEFGAQQIGGNTIMREGLEIDRFFVYQADGVYGSQEEIDAGPTPGWPAKPGDIRITDVNGDGRITADDRVDVSGAHPAFEYALDLFASWKRFDVSALVQGEQGRRVPVNGWGVLPFAGGTGVLAWWRDAWSPENPDSDKPRLLHAGFGNTSNWANSTYWLRDVSYTRLKNVTLGYTLPESVAGSFGMSRARIYLNGENLLTWTPFELGDPERAGNLSYPFFRTLTVGIDVSF